MDIPKTEMTDEQRLGLPEEPPRELMTKIPLKDLNRRFAQWARWGYGWREKALELQQERDEMRNALRDLANWSTGHDYCRLDEMLRECVNKACSLLDITAEERE